MHNLKSCGLEGQGLPASLLTFCCSPLRKLYSLRFHVYGAYFQISKDYSPWQSVIKEEPISEN